MIDQLQAPTAARGPNRTLFPTRLRVSAALPLRDYSTIVTLYEKRSHKGELLPKFPFSSNAILLCMRLLVNYLQKRCSLRELYRQVKHSL